MNPYTTTTNGPLVVVGFDGSISLFAQPALTTQLLVYEQNVGNFKDPTRFSWEKIVRLPYYGETISVRPFGVSTGSGYHGYDMPQPTVSGALFTELYNETVSKIYDAIRGGTDLSVDAFQARQAVRMFRDVSKLDSLIPRVRLPYAKVLRPLKALASKHLEWKYGWKPLVDSIYGTLDECYKHYAGDFTQTLRKRSKREFHFQSIGQIDSGPATDKRMTDHTFRCEIKIQYKLPEDRLDQLAGYTSLNPVSIAWELVPWSFVVDWFIDVGGYLRNLESALIYGRAFRSGYVTYSYLLSGSSKLQGTNTVGPGSTNGYNLSASYRHTRLNRLPLIGIPFPAPPVLNTKPFSAERLLTGAALLSTKLR